MWKLSFSKCSYVGFNSIQDEKRVNYVSILQYQNDEGEREGESDEVLCQQCLPLQLCLCLHIIMQDGSRYRLNVILLYVDMINMDFYPNQDEEISGTEDALEDQIGLGEKEFDSNFQVLILLPYILFILIGSMPSMHLK